MITYSEEWQENGRQRGPCTGSCACKDVPVSSLCIRFELEITAGEDDKASEGLDISVCSAAVMIKCFLGVVSHRGPVFLMFVSQDAPSSLRMNVNCLRDNVRTALGSLAGGQHIPITLLQPAVRSKVFIVH